MMKDNQKEILIQSMNNLFKYILEGSQQQVEIFQSLSVIDFQKIFDNLKDTNINLRKVSGLFLCQILNDNISIQQLYCELNEISAFPGFISLNEFPRCFNISEKTQKALFQELKNQQNQQQNNNILCWYINQDCIDDNTSQIKVKYLKPGINNYEIFFDPQDTLFGFMLQEPKQEKKHVKSLSQKPVSISNKIQINSTKNNRNLSPTDFVPINSPQQQFYGSFIENKIAQPQFMKQNEQVKKNNQVPPVNNQVNFKPAPKNIQNINNYLTFNQQESNVNRVQSPVIFNVRNQNIKFNYNFYKK